jgi:hypothetical protein
MSHLCFLRFKEIVLTLFLIIASQEDFFDMKFIRLPGPNVTKLFLSLTLEKQSTVFVGNKPYNSCLINTQEDTGLPLKE